MGSVGYILDSVASESGKIVGGILAGVFGFLWIKLKTKALDFLPARAEFLAINPSNLPVRARAAHESYDHALGIHIHHQGGPNCYIVSAAFRPPRSILPFKHSPGLPIYPGAFRSRRHKGAYELKFGSQWEDPDLLLRSGERTVTYLPLSGPVPDLFLSERSCGTVIIDYATSRKVGTHKVAI